MNRDDTERHALKAFLADLHEQAELYAADADLRLPESKLALERLEQQLVSLGLLLHVAMITARHQTGV